MPVIRYLLPLMAAVLLTACIEPAAPRPFEGELRHRLTLFTVLDPASPPALLIIPTTGGEPFAVEAYLDSVEGIPSVAFEGSLRCPHGSAGPRNRHCLRFDLLPESRRTYTVRVEAPGYPSASGTATVPGDFRIVEYDAAGDPPGSDGLSVEWTESEGAHVYLVAIRAAETPRCYVSCENGWSVYTTATRFSGRVPLSSYAEGEGPWTLDVYALEEHLYRYLTSGTSGSFFSVPHASNVDGGYGVIGAWVRRSAPLSTAGDGG